MKKWMLLTLIFFCHLVFSHTIILDPNQDIKTLIEHGVAGDVFYLKSGKYLIDSTIHPPSGTTVQGQGKETILQQNTFTETAFIFFNLDNTNNVTVKKLAVIEANATVFFTSNANFESNDIVIDDISIHGNTQYALSSEEEARIAIYLDNMNRLQVSNCEIKYTKGGIYTSGENINIFNNHLTAVNFGNIVVGGKHLNIIGNIVNQSGKGTLWQPPSGDSITISPNSFDVKISENILNTGYCYMIWIHSSVNKLTLTNNVIKDSVTTGVYIEDANNFLIQNNTFAYNRTSGLGFVGYSYNVTVKNNQFINNGLVLFDAFNAYVFDNNFINISREKIAINIGETIIRSNNKIQFSNDDDFSALILGTPKKGYFAQPYTEVELQNKRGSKLNLSVVNKGQNEIKLLDYPQIKISDNSSSEANETDRKITISTYDQPDAFTVLPGETLHFQVSIDTDESHLEFFIKILTNTGFVWYKITLDQI